MKQTEYTIGINDQNRRLDRILKIAFPRRSVGDLYKALRKGLILVNGKKAGPDTRLKEGDRLVFKGALAEEIVADSESPAPGAPLHEILPVVWENDDLICLNKPRGQLVHGQGSLEIQVRASLAGRITDSLAFTPGPLHRLDRNTSGLIMFSRSLRGAQLFTERLRHHQLIKLYLAVLEGRLLERQRWEDPLLRQEGMTIRDPQKGSMGTTEVLPLLTAADLTLAVLRIYTGKTHQIRAQAAHHGHPLTGDVKYGGSSRSGGFRLHAWQLIDPDVPPLFPPLRAAPPDSFFCLLPADFTLRELESLWEKRLRGKDAEGFFSLPLGKGVSGE